MKDYSIYRGFKDILPSEINPIYSGNEGNIFGSNAGYFAFYSSIAQDYAFKKMNCFGVCVKYKFSPQMEIELHEGMDYVTEDGKIVFSKSGQKKLKTEQLDIPVCDAGDFIMGLGFDCIIIYPHGSLVQEGDCIFIIKNPSILTPISIDVATKFKSQDLLLLGDMDGHNDESYNLIYGSHTFNYYPVFNISFDKISEIESILKIKKA